MENFMDTETLTRNFKEQISDLQREILGHRAKIASLSCDLDIERYKRGLVEEKLKNMTEAFAHVQGELKGILAKLEDNNHDDDEQSFKVDEQLREHVFMTLNHLSNHVNQKLDEYRAKRERTLLKVIGMNSALKNLEGQLQDGNTSTITCSSSSPALPAKRVSKKPSRLIDEIATQESFSQQQRSSSRSDLKDKRSCTPFPGSVINGSTIHPTPCRPSTSMATPVATPLPNHDLPAKRVPIKPVRLVDEMMMDQNNRSQQRIMAQEEKAKQVTKYISPSQPEAGHALVISTRIENKFHCICGHSSLRKSKITEHVKYYTQEWMFTCHLCVSRFSGASDLKRHLEKLHKVQLNEAVKRMVGCKDCGGMFGSRKELTQHRLKEHKIPSYLAIPIAKMESIMIPKKTNKQKPYLQHQIGKDGRHHGKDDQKHGPEVYCVCGEKFKRSHLLIQHVTYFTSEWKFSCEVCGSRFIGANYLRKHMIKAHKATPGNYAPSYGCRQCGKLLPSFGKLVEHRRIKHRYNGKT